MAIKRRLSLYSGMRIDVPHIRSIESSASNDFDDVLRGLVTGLNQPYLIRGFRIQVPTAAISASSLQIEVADSAVLHSSASESGTILTVPATEQAQQLDATNSKVIGAFQNGTLNYVSLDYRRVTSNDTVDQTSGWSASQKTEFQRTAPIGRVLEYRFIINTTGFSTNLPLYIVKTSSTGVVEYITKAASGLFRLGSGGSVPNPGHSFDFKNLINENAANPRQEWISSNGTLNPMSVEPSDPSSAFDYGDWSIRNLKEWMDAIMTRLKEVSGSNYWYMDSNSTSANSYTPKDVWTDSGAGSLITGSGNISYNLILEVTKPSIGSFQSLNTDPSISQGQSYIRGLSSGVQASLAAFNANQLVINSMTRGSFAYGETIYNRRKYFFDSNYRTMSDTIDGPNQVADVVAKNVSPQSSQVILSWSYTGTLVTLDVADTSMYKVGESIFVSGLGTATPAPNGVFMIKHLTPTTIKYSALHAPVGAAVGSGTVGLTNQSKHPYLPYHSIQGWSYVGNQITVTSQNHNFINGQFVVISGLNASSNVPNGRYQISSSVSNEFTFTALTPTGTPTVDESARARYDSHNFLVTATGADQSSFNRTDANAYALDDCNFSYIIDDDSAPSIGYATGPISFDAVIAESVIQDPVQVTYIQYLSGDIVVSTSVPHGLSPVSNVSFVIFGNSQNSPYIRRYTNVDISVDSSTQFTISNSNLPPYPDYDNLLLEDGTYARYHSNPYPGPIVWDKDIVIKTIIGDLSFTVPQLSIAEGTPVANQFNTNGLTGSAYLQDGDVMYVELERDELVTGGAHWSCAGGSNPIIGPQLPEDKNGDPLTVGDFVKFETETDSKWLKISSIVSSLGTSSIYLTTDTGLPPVSSQRPANNGKLLYCKGAYPIVQVASHSSVPSSPDIYWLAVRRDNGSLKSKVYFRSLEIEAGEVVQVSDNEPSNLLVYTGAGSESTTQPNYSQIQAAGPYQATDTLNILEMEPSTRIVVTNRSPDLGWQLGDTLEQGIYTYVVAGIIDGQSIVIREPIVTMTVGPVTYKRNNYLLDESDNLTLALRKEDREAGRINTALNKTIYNESFNVSRINLSSGVLPIQSGEYIYIDSGNINAPTALAWVLHGTANVNRVIEGASIVMPGGHSSLPANSILVALIDGSFSNGSAIWQNGVSTGRVISDASAPDFVQPQINGGSSNDGVELVLPPNRRTQIKGGGEYIVWPQYSYYKSSLDPLLANEELLVVINDTVREAEVDYSETFSGPRAKIRIINNLPGNTRIRCRTLSTMGSALAVKAGGNNLQNAYDGGNTIVTSSALAPVTIDAYGKALGGASAQGQKIIGSLVLDGNYLGDTINGIFGAADKSFLIGAETNKPKETWTAMNAVKTHSTHPMSAAKMITGAGTSVGSTSYIIPLTKVTLSPNQTVRVEAKFTAKKQSGFAGASFRVEGCFYHNGISAVQADSSLIEMHGAYGEAIPDSVNIGYIASLLVSGQDILPVVYGVTDPVEWAVTLSWQVVGAA